MTIRRGAIATVDHFTIVPNGWVRDDRLSFRSRGLLAYLLSHREGWEISGIRELARHGTEGREAMTAAVQELEVLGYLVRQQTRSQDGRMAGVDYTVTDPEVAGNPVPGNPATGSPVPGNPATKKTTSSEDQLLEDEEPPAAAPRAVEVVLPDTCAATAQTVLGAFIDWRTSQGKGRLSGQTTKAIAASVKRLLADGFDVDHIKRGLVAVDRQGLSPAALARQVEIARDGKATLTGGRPSPAERLAEIAALGERLQAEDDARATHHQLEIGGRP